MNFSMYPNLDKAIASMGKIKQTRFNKKAYQAMEENLQRITPEEYRQLDGEIPYAADIHGCLLTPSAVIGFDSVNHVVTIILLKDIVYVWGSVQTMRMNFIPYNKMHNLHVLSRHGDGLSSKTVNTGGFSKKDIVGPAVEQMRAVIEPRHPGVLYGWTKERENAMMNNFPALVAAVDQARAAAAGNAPTV